MIARLILICSMLFLMSCVDSGQAPLFLDPELVNPEPTSNVVTNMVVIYEDWRETQLLRIRLGVSNNGAPVRLLFQYSDHFGLKVFNSSQQLIFEYPIKDIPNQHYLDVTRYNPIDLNYIFPLDLPPGDYTVHGGLLEHNNEYPWVTRTFKILE